LFEQRSSFSLDLSAWTWATGAKIFVVSVEYISQRIKLAMFFFDLM
jgi:hypothetical protein